MISDAKIYCFSHFICFCAIFFTYIILIQDAARQCPFLHFRAVACAFLSRPPVETQNLASPDWHGIPSLSGVCTCIPQPSSSRDAKSCVSRSACHSFYCQVVVRVFLSLMLVRRKILRLYFCLMAFIVKRHVCRHYAACKRIMRRRCVVTSVARLCLFGVALFFLTYFICVDIFILYLCIRWAALGKLRTSSLSTCLHHLCIRWASARQCQVR